VELDDVPLKKTGLRELAHFAVTRPSQLRDKSHQWFDDVQFLHAHQRWGAAIYLGGFVIECLLKAALWPRRAEPRIDRLLWRSHDLGELLAECRHLKADMRQPRFAEVWAAFQFLGNWTVRIRYNPRLPSAREARDFWERLMEVRQWLLGRT
jgi:hypothetical protein